MTPPQLPLSPLFDEAPIAYSIIDPGGRQLAGNRAYWDLFGYDPADAASLDVLQLTHPDDRVRTRRYLRSLVAGTSDVEAVDKRYVRADGSVFWGRLRARVLRDDDDQPRYLLGVIEDVSDRVEAAERLREIADERATFAAVLSNDIRTPLHAILGLAELLADQDTTDDEVLQSLLGSARELRSMVDEIVQLSRLEMGDIRPVAEPFSPLAMLEELDERCRQSLRRRGLVLEVSADADVPRLVEGSQARVREVLVNLTESAIGAAQGGVIAVSLTGGGPGVLRFRVGEQGSASGTGAEDADPRSTPAPPDLRLAIARRLVDLLGGRLSPSNGAVAGYLAELPLPAVHGAAAAAGAEQPSPSRPEVLVVEDSPVNQLLCRSQLDQIGYEATIVGNGQEAIERLVQADYGAVLMDWHLPDIDGLETTRRIRAIEERHGRRRTPIIALTARTMLGDREQCLDAGMDDFVAKPVTIEALAAALRRWIDRPVVDAAVADPGRSSDTGADLPIVEGVPVDGEVLVDEAVLEALAEDLGDEAIVASLVATFLDELPARRQAISEAATGGELDGARRAAHTLKSTSAMLGAVALGRACRDLEAAAAASDVAELADLVAHVDEEAGRTADRLSVLERFRPKVEDLR